MTSDGEAPEDAITGEEIAGAATPALPASKSTSNAFAQLMSNSKRAFNSASSSPPPKRIANSHPSFFGSAGLGIYLQNPSAQPASRVIFHTESFVAINDLYPKSSVHTLLIARERKWHTMHPIAALSDPEFLELARPQVEKLKGIVASELRRKYGSYSAQDKEREKVLSGEVELDVDADLPKGRNWEDEVMVGIHMHPSMEHLHIHVLSVDRYSECMKKRNHYNSFATPFFVRFSEFPLSEERKEELERKGQGRRWIEVDLKCWRCGERFGNKFARLKEHLEQEFETWKML
ncbi:HIT domain-containing protein [Rutstroemia sp. NJR-2017a BBW]|nr:HIT domain-containing protein [Rutstroemia sp. NJR-2017a BBW]